jgi:hypothetical protein
MIHLVVACVVSGPVLKLTRNTQEMMMVGGRATV